MKMLACFSVALALAVGTSPVRAVELKSGIQPGEAIGPFDVVKCAGAVDDGVDVGDKLCYRCKYGNRPMVMVFSRKADAKLVALAKQLDEQVSKNSKKKLAAFVSLLGDDEEALETKAKELGEKNDVANVPFVVPVEFTDGPGDYGIDPKAEVTVILAVGGKVVANHALEAGKLNDKAVKAILADVPKILE
ncbi:MAG TPA: hypothetical protein VMV69_11630 [Pirellulales bacterium]|nr:hypothetical protein [Pirellulales bacterium]